MSRSYRIAVAESLSRHVKVEDGVQSRLELLPLLPAGRMTQLLGAELEALGFEVCEGQARRQDADGVSVTVDLEQGTVTVRLAAEQQLELTRSASGAVYDPAAAGQAEERLRERAQRELEQQADQQQDKLRAEVTAQLEQKLCDLRQELDGAVNRATAAALKEKAAQLGEIEELSEDADSGSLTIRVRL